MNLIEKDNQYIWHPFTPQFNRKDAIPIVKGQGSYLIDEKGNHYLDAISSWWVNLHGHAHPYIAEKIYRQALQLEHVIFAGFTHPPAVELAERLIKLLDPTFTKVFYSDNGSTSTEVALKMAVQYWWNSEKTQQHQVFDQIKLAKKIKILAFKNAYHGDTFGAMSVSDRSIFTLAFHDLLFEVVFIDTPTEQNRNANFELISQHSDEIAAFIYEPLVQGAGGLKMYDAGLMDELLDFAQQQDIICIADEVMTGFYRTGKFFASDYLQHKPDIICLSKGLTGGTMALGVTACNDRIYKSYVNDDALKTFFHGHSFTANPLACTAALASLDLLNDECLQQIKFISDRHQEYRAQRIHAKGIKNIRALGTLLAFEIDSGADEYLNTISARITQYCLGRGVYLRPLGNTVYLMPPYCITEEELNKLYKVLDEIINDSRHF